MITIVLSDNLLQQDANKCFVGLCVTCVQSLGVSFANFVDYDNLVTLLYKGFSFYERELSDCGNFV